MINWHHYTQHTHTITWYTWA